MKIPLWNVEGEHVRLKPRQAWVLLLLLRPRAEVLGTLAKLLL